MFMRIVRVHVFKYGTEQTLYAHPVTVNHTAFLCRVIYPRGTIMKYSMPSYPRATTGEQGNTGATGLQGATGNRGNTGATGSKGKTSSGGATITVLPPPQ